MSTEIVRTFLGLDSPPRGVPGPAGTRVRASTTTPQARRRRSR